MKVIFLDIDGVLNSVRYDNERTSVDGNIDTTRLVLLKQIVDATDAKIVLSTSWRIHWNSDESLCDSIGRELNSVFRAAGLEIYDRTPQYISGDRASEIKMWLSSRQGEIESFVILDDIFGGWGELNYNLVQTSPLIGRGLNEPHVQKAIKILNQ